MHKEGELIVYREVCAREDGLVKLWKGKIAAWGRWICMAGLAAWVILVVMNSGKAGYSVIEVLMLFGVLFVGYRYGSGTGAIFGIACGVILTLWNGDLSKLGILSLIGLMSGAFRSLGRFAAVIGYFTTAIGIGLIYEPVLLRGSMAELVAAAVLFLILPVQMTMPEEKRQTVVTVAPPLSDFDGSIGTRLRQMEEAFLELAKTFSIETVSREPVANEQEMRWRSRYFENRSVIGEQMMELAELMRSFREELGRTADITMEVEEKIRTRLKEQRLNVERVAMVEGENKRSEVILTLSAVGGRSVTVKEVAEAVSEAVQRKMKPATDSSGAIGVQPRTMRLEEEPRYQMLHGVARTIKEESKRSGDSFSFLNLPRGKVLLSLCDGMGSGMEAFEESSRAMELTEQLLEAGFHPQTVLRLVNNALVMQEDYHPLAMDVAVADLYSGLCDFTKSGAAITLIRHGNKIEMLQSETLPIGIVQETLPMESLYRLRDGDMVIMMTDGVLEAIPGVEKEKTLKEFCKAQQSTNPKEIAGQILNFALEQSEEAKDDMTVLVAGMWKK